MASLIVLLIILACGAYQYFKGTFVRSFALFITAVCAAVVAFAYFEPLASLFIARNSLVNSAQAVCFISLFVLAFALFQVIVWLLTRKRAVDLGLWPERIARPLFAVLAGLVISGTLITAAAIAPLSDNLPYRRFNERDPDPERPRRVLFNADGFATGWFNLLSSSSLSGKKSFAALHPAFLNQLFLNRHNTAGRIALVTRLGALELPKRAAWLLRTDLKDSQGKRLLPKPAHNFTVVRVGIRRNALKDAGTFNISQLRLIATKNADKPLTARGKNLYPRGYLKAADQLQSTKLNDRIKLEAADFRGQVKYIDFVFELPDGLVPALVEFKQNNVARLQPLVPPGQVPPVMPFIALSDCATDIAQLKPLTSARLYGVELAARFKFLAGSNLTVSTPGQLQSAQTERSIAKARFDKNSITYVKAQLDGNAIPPKNEKTKSIAEMLKPLKGYTLLSLKCNNPSPGTPIKAHQLPVLVEAAGPVHHPVGVIASGRVGAEIIWQLDYCCIPAADDADGLVIAKDGSVEKPFVDTIWLTREVQKVSEFYLLYLVKRGKTAIIISVRPGGLQTAAPFDKYEGFLIK